MKLIFAVVQAQDTDACADALTDAGFVCTRFVTQGGFLESENCTLMLGVDDAQVDQVVEILRRRGQRRVEALDTPVTAVGMVAPSMVPSMDVEVGGATVLVVPLERIEKL